MKCPKWQLLTLAITLLIFTNCNTTETIEDATQEVAEVIDNESVEVKKLLVNAPLEKVEAATHSFSVKAEKGITFTMDNGSSIEIPANAFVDKKGNIVTGNVEISYQEYHTPAQIISSGIPMKVITEDGEEWMQTAGMFKIEGSQKEEQVFIAKGKSINVNMASYVDGEYDFWYLDEKVGNWDNLGVSQPTANSLGNNGDQVVGQTGANIKRPSKPIAYNEQEALNFELDYSDFPALKDKKGLVWQYAGNSKEQSPAKNEWIYNEDWTDIELKEKGKEQYQVTLTSDRKTYSIPVVAVLTGQDYEAAMAAYQEQFKAYEAALELSKNQEVVQKQRAEFLRSYAVEDFGIYNYDILYKDKRRMQLAVDFEFEGIYNSAAFKKNAIVYLITADDRAVVPYDDTSKNQFSMNPNAENKLVAILPDNKVAVFSAEDFEANKSDIIAARGGHYTFKLSMVEQAIASVEELDNVIL